MIVAGGGVLYSEATDALRRFVDATGIAVGETQAGKGSLPDPHPLSLGGVGATGTRAANLLARDADLVIVVGSRLSDFTTASKTAFQHERVRFIAINVAEIDAGKHAALPLVGDARAVLDELLPLVAGLSRRRGLRRDDRRLRRRSGARRWIGSATVVSLSRQSRSPQSRQSPSSSRRTSSACCRRRSRRPTSSSAPPAACRAICTSCGARAIRRAITWSTATRAWATRSPAGSA